MTTPATPTGYDDESAGPRLWDAGAGVCCAAFQLGACSHTEGAYYDDEDIEAEVARRAEEALVPSAARLAGLDPTAVAEHFYA